MTAHADLPPTTIEPLPAVAPRYSLRRMRPDDIVEVGHVERRCFSNPWPVSAYRRELQHPDQNHYLVLRANAPSVETEHVESPNGARPRQVPRRTLLPLGFGRRGARTAEVSPVVGFAGMWSAFDEAHITTIAIDEPFRGRRLGEVLLAALFDEADRRRAIWLTLEVRVSNEAAQALYRKWGFEVQGTRRRYYSDNDEDAHIMWSRALTDAAYRTDLGVLRAVLAARVGGAVEGFSPRMAVRPPGPPAAAPWEPKGRRR